jgi:two-component system sensor histidine kinase PilS (NtrC family)
VIVIEDVTELHRLREVSTRDERLVGVGKLAASMAHEIRNPLASLTGSLQLIHEDRPERLVEIALQEAQRLNRLVEDFLSISRQQRLHPRPTDLHALVSDVAAAFARVPRFSETVRIAVRGSVAVATVDPDRLRQVVWNLVLNGAQAMPRGGEILVQAGERAEYEQGPEGVEVVIRDQGPGISEADRGRIFDPFFTTRSGGSGLGLATVDQIIRSHSGRITVHAPAEGGTALVLWLPKEPHVG